MSVSPESNSPVRGVTPAAPGNPIVRRLRAYGLAPRILGIDIARGLAVIGMFGAHIGVTVPWNWLEPSTWLDVVHGRSSILFALLAGVSIAILSGALTPVAGNRLLQARVRILVRAGLIFAIGGLLESLGTRIAVILPVYALLFVVTIPVLRWRSRSLFLLAGALAVVSPVIHVFLAPLPDTVLSREGAFPNLVFWGAYPAVIWVVFVLVGLGIGRLDLRAPRVQGSILGAGVALAILGYGAGDLAWDAIGRTFGDPGMRSSTADYAGQVEFGSLFTTAAHSGSTFEVVGSTGFALTVLGLCLLVATRLRWLLYPVAAVGAMALTAYTVHVVVLAALGDDAFEQQDNTLYLVFVAAALLGCTLWTILVGRGPLERLLTTLSRRVAVAAVGRNESASFRAPTLDTEPQQGES